MILIDPELEPDATPKSVSAKPSAAVLSPKPVRLPSTRTLARFLSRAQAAVRLRGQVTVLLTRDAAMRDLNQRFRGKNKATDVLAFPSGHLVRGTEKIAGDLAIGVETALRQAAEQGHALAVELKVLMLHGLLHLAGHDHETDEGEMQRRERRLRARLGLPLGLIERAASPALSQKARKDGATSGEYTSGAKAITQDGRVSARLKPRPDTRRSGKP